MVEVFDDAAVVAEVVVTKAELRLHFYRYLRVLEIRCYMVVNEEVIYEAKERWFNNYVIVLMITALGVAIRSVFDNALIFNAGFEVVAIFLML